MSSRVLFWDIDGTLLTTGRAGMHAWQDALRAEIGLDANVLDFDTAGLPDPLIARRLLATLGMDGNPDAARRLLRGYEQRLPQALPRRSGRVLPNVREILDALRGLPDLHSMLLTGNTRAGAQAKLTYYGLAEYFQGGAFSDDVDDRAMIAQNALRQARSIMGEIHPDRVYVIGDTPHDIACGRGIGARVVAVATGQFSLAELSEHGPWWALEQLPPAEEFLRRLGASASEYEWRN